MLETSNLPSTILMFPGLTDRVYYQNPETKEFWFHATSVCKTLGYSNVTSALGLHCDEDEKFQEIWQGKATWFVSESGCYGLAMGAKNDIAKGFKRWLKHDVLPKLRASGGYIMPTATSEQLEALKSAVTELQRERELLLSGVYVDTVIADFIHDLLIYAPDELDAKGRVVKHSFVSGFILFDRWNEWIEEKSIVISLDFQSFAMKVSNYFASLPVLMEKRMHIQKPNSSGDVENAILSPWKPFSKTKLTSSEFQKLTEWQTYKKYLQIGE